MAITEEDRHRLYQRLEQVLGSHEAATMMEHLPPVGWADVATKRDLDQFSTLLRTEMGSMENRLQAEFHRALNQQTFALIAAFSALAALAIALGHIG